MHTITIQTTLSSYPIYLGSSLLKDAGLLLSHIVGKQVCIVSNAEIAELYLPLLQKNLHNKTVSQILIPQGEQHKTLETLSFIFDHLLQTAQHRSTTLIALGGGVVGDMTGFAAACYLRGVNFIQIPTSLLAQVDASIGGKTGVNHILGKNMIGAFYQPQAVIIDTDTLKTLPRREFIAGLAEVIKHALIADADYFTWIEQHITDILALKSAALLSLIQRSCEIKAEIVAVDEYDKTGKRALLNFGHTFGHALESLTHYTSLLHGEAVAIGMVMACQISHKRNLLSENVCLRVKALLEKVGLPTQMPTSINKVALIQEILRDKKANNSSIFYIFLTKIGHAQIESIDKTQLLELLGLVQSL